MLGLHGVRKGIINLPDLVLPILVFWETPVTPPIAAFRQSLREIFRRAIQELCPDDGIPQKELDDAERQLGFNIPGPLRVFYGETGRMEFNQAFNRLRAPSQIEVHGDMALFAEENQCVVYFGFRIADVAQEDPAAWQLNPSEGKWYLECQRMTLFLLRMVCWQAVCGGAEAAAIGELSPPDYRRLEATYDRVGAGEVDEDDMQAFEKDGVIVCAFPETGGCQVYCGSNDAAKIEHLANRFGLDII